MLRFPDRLSAPKKLELSESTVRFLESYRSEVRLTSLYICGILMLCCSMTLLYVKLDAFFGVITILSKSRDFQAHDMVPV